MMALPMVAQICLRLLESGFFVSQAILAGALRVGLQCNQQSMNLSFVVMPPTSFLLISQHVPYVGLRILT